MFDGLKIFSATKSQDRNALDSLINRWIEENRSLKIVDKDIRLSSDNEFHCLVVILYYVRTTSKPA